MIPGITLRASWRRNVDRMVGTANVFGLTAVVLPFMTSPWAAALAMFIMPRTIMQAESSAAAQFGLADLTPVRLGAPVLAHGSALRER